MIFRVSHWHLNLIHKTPGEAQPGHHGSLHPLHVLGLPAHGFQVLPNMWLSLTTPCCLIPPWWAQSNLYTVIPGGTWAAVTSPADSHPDVRWLSGLSPCGLAPARLPAAGLGFLLWDPNAPRDCPQHHSLCSLSPPKGSSHPCSSCLWVCPGLNSIPPQIPSGFSLSSHCFPTAVWGWSLKGPSSSRTWTPSPRSSIPGFPALDSLVGKQGHHRPLHPGAKSSDLSLTDHDYSNGGHPGFTPSCRAPLCTQPWALVTELPQETQRLAGVTRSRRKQIGSCAVSPMDPTGPLRCLQVFAETLMKEVIYSKNSLGKEGRGGL